MTRSIYVCPISHSPVRLIIQEEEQGQMKRGYFESEEGARYPVENGLPDFSLPAKLTPLQQQQHEYYEAHAAAYDEIQWLTFAIQNEDESAVRKEMIPELGLRPNSKVLEIGCGTGRDSVNIAASLGPEGEFYLQDFSRSMIQRCREKLANSRVRTEFCVGTASHLPFPDKYFDAVFSFGGLNAFGDIRHSLQEMVRVTKVGGKIVAGDESMPPWLRETEFGKILINGNPLFKATVPLECIPVQARRVSVRWIIGGVYYLISFTVGDGEPVGNFDIEIPGKRGGTLRTRYSGQLEGVTEETKKLVIQAAATSRLSVHQWLEQVLRPAAERDSKSSDQQASGAGK